MTFVIEDMNLASPVLLSLPQVDLKVSDENECLQTRHLTIWYNSW